MAIHSVSTALNVMFSPLTSITAGDTLSNNQVNNRNMALQEQFHQLLHSSNTTPERDALTAMPASDPQAYLNMQEKLATSTVEVDLVAKTVGSITQSITKLANMQ